MTHDGEIRFCTKIDNSEAQKDLNDLNRRIRKANEEISRDENAKLPLTNQARELGAHLDGAVAKLEKLKAKQQEVAQIMADPPNPELYIDAVSQKPELDASIKAQEKEVAKLQAKWDSVNDKIDKYDLKIKQAKASIEANTAKAGELSAELSKCEDAVALSKNMSKANDSATRFKKRIWELGKSALIFNAMSSGLRNMVNYMGQVLKSNEQYTNRLAKLKGALLTAFQPLYEVALPGLVAVLDVLTAIVRVAASILAFVTGRTTKQSAENAEALYNEANAIGAVGSAAKKAKSQLAGFDEINKLGSNDAAGGGGSSGGITPEFDVFDGSKMTEILERINELVLDIGFAFLAWKVVGRTPQALQTVLGALIAIGGALIYATNMEDAFLNSFNWENLTGMVVGLAAVVVGLALAFGSVGAAVGLLIGGIGLIVVALNELFTTGTLTNEALAAIETGILVVGAALALFTGSWIPLAIAALVGFAVAAVARTDEVKALLQQFDEWLQGVFAKDWTEIFGPVLGGALNRFFDWTQGVWEGVKMILNGFVDFVNGIFAGDFQKAWDGIAEIFRGVWGGFLGIVQPVFDGIAAIWEELGNILPESWKGAINAVVEMVNKFTSWLNSTLQWNMPPIKVGGVTLYEGGSFGLHLPQIPYLAKGAVIPPNREFLAVLGDQKHGTNVEAPLSTIQEAVALVMEDMTGGMMAGFQALLEENRLLREVVESMEIGDEAVYRANKRYTEKINTIRGRA